MIQTGTEVGVLTPGDGDDFFGVIVSTNKVDDTITIRLTEPIRECEVPDVEEGQFANQEEVWVDFKIRSLLLGFEPSETIFNEAITSLLVRDGDYWVWDKKDDITIWLHARYREI